MSEASVLPHTRVSPSFARIPKEIAIQIFSIPNFPKKSRFGATYQIFVNDCQHVLLKTIIWLILPVYVAMKGSAILFAEGKRE